MTRRRTTAKALAGVRPGTVLDHYTSVYGVHKGAWRAAHFVQIALVVQEHGRNFSNKNYMDYWGVSERTAWDHRAEAREVYGEDRWRDVAEALLEAVEEAGVKGPGRAVRVTFSAAA